MPYRREGEDYIRDPLSAAAPRDYLVHKESPSRILDFYESCAPEDRSHDAPDNWPEIDHEVKGDGGRIVLRNRDSHACVEVTYKLLGGMKTDFEVHPLSREEAYRLCLDQDEWHISRPGPRYFNERHPRPAD